MLKQTGSPTRWRRRDALGVFLLGTLACAQSGAQEVATLRPGEVIELPGGRISVLGVDIRRGASTRVSLRLRATASPKADWFISADTFRLLADGVPRALDAQSIENSQPSSLFLVARESAVDFTRVFSIADKSDDLVLQLRIGDAVERRRLPKR